MWQNWLDFWCERCRRWTEQAHDSGSSVAYCDDCGEVYQCGECGEDLNQNGSCRRPTCLQHE